MPYLIDGHNLIPKLGLRLDSPDDEMDLIAVLQEFCRLSRRECEVYFDGAPAGEAGRKKFGAVTAHFVRAGTTADSAIKARLRKMERAARNWIVVSSDHEIQNAARAAKAKAASSEEFARLLKKIQPNTKPNESTSRTMGDKELSPEEIENWSKLFNKKNQ